MSEYSLKEPPKVLEFLLAPVALSLEHLRHVSSMPRTSIIEIFQEFWFICVYFGYQPKLRWSDGWKHQISIIALSTPVLIQERRILLLEGKTERITQLGQALLSKNVNQDFKAHLITFMPNCAQIASTLSIGQCLWLFSFYQSESFKFSIGYFDDLFKYLSSETIEHLSLFPFVNDISLTVLAS